MPSTAVGKSISLDGLASRRAAAPLPTNLEYPASFQGTNQIWILYRITVPTWLISGAPVVYMAITGARLSDIGALRRHLPDSPLLNMADRQNNCCGRSDLHRG